MSTFTTVEYVCLVTPARLEAKRAALRKEHSRSLLIQEALWRQINLTADATSVVIRLGNVAEEAASGGYCGVWYQTQTIRLTWDDILDRDGLVALFWNEPVCVFEKANAMLEVLRTHMKLLRVALAA